MSAFRRDLFQRRLWPVIALLLVAVIAVPLLLHENASADATPTPAAPRATSVAALTPAPTATVRARPTTAVIPRDPFTGAVVKTGSPPASRTTTTGGASASTSTTTAASAPAASADTSSPSSSSTATPAPTSSSTATPAPTSTSTATSPATSTTTPTTSTTPAVTPTTPAKTPPDTGSWTIYAVNLRVGKDRDARLRSDVARLTPLPSVAAPKVMFMGVMAGGRQAVFALAASVAHAGPGLCRPDRARCATIVLKAGQTEQITVATADAGHRVLFLKLVRITQHITHSRRAALAAYARQSAAGRCELDLNQPESYSETEGTISRVAATACRHQPAAVAFPGAPAKP